MKPSIGCFDPEGDPWENLASSIVYVAVLDYKSLCEAYKLSSTLNKPNLYDKIIYEEKIFRSEYFAMLTDLDYEMLMTSIKKEVFGDDYQEILRSGKRDRETDTDVAERDNETPGTIRVSIIKKA